MYDKFINPYNFIPLGTKRAYEVQEERNLSGVIHYSLKTVTPLFIPNSANPDAFPQVRQEYLRDIRTFFPDNEEGNKEYDSCAEKAGEHKMYDFFTYTDISDTRKDYRQPYAMPVIPGSEIRGMLRSNFETLTNSCMSSLNSDVILSKRTSEIFSAGLIKKDRNGTFTLYKAKIYNTPMEGSLPEGSRLYFVKGRNVKKGVSSVRIVGLYDEESNNGKSYQSGYLLKGMEGPTKKHWHVFYSAIADKINSHDLKTSENVVKSRISLKILDMVLDEYQTNNDNAYQEYRERLTDFRENATIGSCFPVYYSKVGNDLLLSPACITREIYHNTLGKTMRSYVPCDGETLVCPACSLFGMLAKGKSLTSRLRFSDMSCVNRDNPAQCYAKIVTLPPLSSPKRSNTEFILKKPDDAWFWTYDYYVNSEGTIIPYLPEANGRKFYWHNLHMKLPENIDMTGQNMTIRPVDEKIEFSGKLYFQKISERELSQLIWLLNCGDDADTLDCKKHGYKLGAAKPLGFGSVAMKVDSAMLRTVKMDDESSKVILGEEPWTSSYIEPGIFDTPESQVEKDFYRMTSFYEVSENQVSYPVLEEGKEFAENGYEWFTQNHAGFNHNYNSVKKMPNTRKDMIFRMHMEAMNPNLKYTDEAFIEDPKEKGKTKNNG